MMASTAEMVGKVGVRAGQEVIPRRINDRVIPVHSSVNILTERTSVIPSPIGISKAGREKKSMRIALRHIRLPDQQQRAKETSY